MKNLAVPSSPDGDGNITFGSRAVAGRDRELGVSQRGAIVAADAAHAREHGVGGRGDVRGASGLGKRALLVGDASEAGIVSICAPSQPSLTSTRARSGPGGSDSASSLEQREHVVLPSPAAW